MNKIFERNIEEMIPRIEEDIASSPVDGVCVLDKRDWEIIKKHLQSSNGCKCVTKLTEIKGLCLMYPRYECPVHGHLHALYV